jgi:hypothetical protein
MWIDLLAFYLCTSVFREVHMFDINIDVRFRTIRPYLRWKWTLTLPTACHGTSGIPRGDEQDARHPPHPPTPCAFPPGNVHPPPPLSSLKGWLWEKMRQWATCDLIIFFLPRFILYKKTVTNFSKIWVWDPRSRIQARKKPIPDPGSKGQKGTGSRVRIRNTV